MQHVLYIPERHRTLDAKHRSQAYDLGAGFGVAKTAGSLSSGERVQTAGRSRPTFWQDPAWGSGLADSAERGASCRPAPGRWSRWLLAAIGVEGRGVSGLLTGPVSVHPVGTHHRRSSEPSLRAETLPVSLVRAQESVVFRL